MGDLKTNRQVALNRVVNPLIDYFISVCDRVGTSLSLVEGIPAAKIKTIYNGVELSMYRSGPEARLNARKKLGIDCGVFVVGMVCRLRPEKDIGLFLRAVAAVARKSGNMLAMVVGDWDRKDQGMVDQYFQYLREAGVDKKVIFTGFIDDIRDYVDSMDVVCLTPGKNEGLSNSLLEKMAMGKAVIATDVGGNEELVVHGETGFIISPADEDALVESILTLKENPQLRTAMGANGRRRIEGYFTVQKMIENTEALYRTLLTRRTIQLGRFQRIAARLSQE
jgi:glycosyltransferase involved in cell wall biosynthesis